MTTKHKITFVLLLLVWVIISTMFAVEVNAITYQQQGRYDKPAADSEWLALHERRKEPEEVPEPEIEAQPVTQIATQYAPVGLTDVELIARTLAGESFEFMPEDKRKVAETILNRVSVGGFGGSTIYDVLTAPTQFDGYWRQSRPVSEDDIEIATQVLNDWYANGCQALSGYLYFSAGGGDSNVFRETY